ncbi:MAG: glycosyltransferase family 4 protein [Butyrivibrio sp.]|jgi:glycosyltransferase involved in cell wall biosynthesis|nr:glycosyltransferase family 4 protein [Butyrivibrio sp.]
MRIGIDARPFKNKNYSGIPQSIYEVINRWMDTKTEDEFYLISNTNIEIPRDLPNNWNKVIVPAFTGNGTLWQLFRLKRIIRKLKLDWYWGTNFMLPGNVKGCKYLLTIHDLAFEIMPEVVSDNTLLILKMLCKKSCRRADIIHAVSESTKKDISKCYAIDSNKIAVVYWGTSEESEKKANIGNKLLCDYKYILVLGTIEPRKNIETIVKAYNFYMTNYQNDIHIVFAGRYGWKYDKFCELVNNSKHKDHIHILDYVDNDIKEQLLNNAELLLYPSLYEGFGLPILESYKHKLPVITTNISSIPEVAGRAAFYVDDPYDYKAISSQISNVLSMDDLEKNRRINMMQEQIKKFSWEITADELYELF